MTQLPTLKSETFTPDGGLASWMLDAERGKKALAKARARRHLMDFIKYTFPEYDVNWHHEIICKYLERWAFGTGRWAIKRLMIFAPPGSGKSELVSRRLPAWIFGRNPDVGIMTTSYSASLAQDMNVDVQRIINSDLYSEIFPETFLSGKGKGSKSKDSWAQNKNVFEIVGHKGYYKCAGVGGSVSTSSS